MWYLGDHFKSNSVHIVFSMAVIVLCMFLNARVLADEESLPILFSLNNKLFMEYCYVTPVKYQSGGTCWCHGTLAAIESNLLMTGYWRNTLGRYDWPNLAEYHLDWWNGFNKYANDDTSPRGGSGLTVHNGGDYLVASAYMARGDGPVIYDAANDDSEYDKPWYKYAPDIYDEDYDVLYIRDIEWYTAGENLETIDNIKQAIVNHGAVATCIAYSRDYLKDGIFYQAHEESRLPNHSVALVGWFDYMETRAEKCGAWIVKNSWGSGWEDEGYFWISYYDKYCCQEPNMGAVSFQNVQVNPYGHIYFHDYHGWRDTKEDCHEAFNAFTTNCAERIVAVSFFTAAEDVSYVVKIYDRFEGSELLGQLCAASGEIAHRGFHTVDYESPITLTKGDDFYVYLELSHGGQAYDRTSTIDLLMGPSGTGPGSYREQSVSVEASSFDFETMGKMLLDSGNLITVPSHSFPGQSYYRDGSTWRDLYEFDNSANFCIKALTVISETDLNHDEIIDVVDFSELASAWITMSTDDLWDPRFDLNADDIVNAQDIAILGAEWLRDKSLIADWKLDETDGIIAHDSTGSYDGEIHGNPRWKPDEGIMCGALFFDGYYDDYVSTPFILDPNDGAFSVFAWMKGGKTAQVIVSQAEGGGTARNWLSIDMASGRLRTDLQAPGSSGSALISNRAVIPDQWHKIGFVWDGLRRHLYIDSIEVARDYLPLPGLESATEGLCIGKGSGLISREYFRGLIDDVRIYKGVIEP